MSEVELRRELVRLVAAGVSQVEAARRLSRSDRWARKWLRRYETDGDGGLLDRSRAPHRSPQAISDECIQRIVAVRAELTDREFASVGGEAIHYELWASGWSPLPSVATIQRVLQRQGLTRRPTRRYRSQRGSFPTVTRPGILQQSDWVGPLWVGDRQRFSSLHLVDVGGGGAACRQYTRTTQRNAAAFFTEHAWPRLGIPTVISMDNQFPWTTHRDNSWTLSIRACLAFGVETIITAPGEFGFNNHIESFNQLWQVRTVKRHHYPNFETVQDASDRFVDYYLHQRPHPRLTIAAHGTRHPADLLTTSPTRTVPTGFQIADYQHRDGVIRIPLTRGRLTFLRRVQPGGTILIARSRWPVPATIETHTPVAATINTTSRRITIRYGPDIIARYPYPITEPVIKPFHPPAPRPFYPHHTGTMW